MANATGNRNKNRREGPTAHLRRVSLSAPIDPVGRLEHMLRHLDPVLVPNACERVMRDAAEMVRRYGHLMHAGNRREE